MSGGVVGRRPFEPFEQRGVRFEPEGHRYTLDGDPVLNVTSILRAHRISARWDAIPPDVLERKRALGHAVHAATHYFDENDLQVDTVARDVVPYLQGWDNFVRDTGFEPVLLETRLVHPLLRYGGTVDRWGVLRKICPWPAIVDLKTGDPEDAGAGPQTYAYEDLIRALLPQLFVHLQLTRDTPLPFDLAAVVDEPWTRYSVQLKPNGTYRLHTYTSSNDRKRFSMALSLEASAHPSWSASHAQPATVHAPGAL